MKNIVNRLTILALALGTLVSCDWDENEFPKLVNEVDPDATYYLQFTSTSADLASDFDSAGDPTEIQTTVGVKILGLPRDSDLTVNITVDGSSTAAPNMYTLGATSLTIPAGSTRATTTLSSIINNIPVGETVTIVLNLDAGGNAADFGSQTVFSFTRTAPCAWLPGIYTIEMSDSYGDGWQTTAGLGGAGMTIEIDGTVTEFGMCTLYEPSPYAGCVAGDYFNAVTTVEIPVGAISVKWTFPGDWYGEIGYNIINPDGVTIISVPTGAGVAGEIVFDETLVCTNL